MEFKPTNRKPLSNGGKALDKEFSNIDLTEVDSVLNEKEQSFKKKVWDLSKMESLVFSDPKLNAKYDDMSEDGQEKYGYHYNETIMNMLFNEYVTNDAGYRQKYLNAVPEKKERRDKSGIHQLQQKGEEKMQQNSAAPKTKTEGDVPLHNNSLEGVIEEDGMNNNLNRDYDAGATLGDSQNNVDRINRKYDTTPNTMEENDINKSNVQRMNKNFSDKSASQANSDAIDNTSGNPLSTDDVRKYDSDNKTFDTMSVDSDEEYVENQYESEIKETTGAASSGAFSTALGAKNNVYESKSLGAFTSDKDNKSKENESENNEEEQIDETTTSASSGAFEGPFRKKSKDHVSNKPAWHGGEMVSESYLVNSEFFKKIHDNLNESLDTDSISPMAEYDMTNPSEDMEQNLKNAYKQMSDLMKSSDPASKKSYDYIKQNAQNWAKQLGVQFKEPKNGGFINTIKRGLGIGEGEVNEDGMGDVKNSMGNLMGGINSKEEKIKQIIEKGKNKFGDFEMLNNLPDVDVDRILQQVMGNQTAINPMGEAKLNKPELNSPDLNEGGKHMSYTQLADILDNTPVEQEEELINNFISEKGITLGEFKYKVQDFIKGRLQGSDSPQYYKMENIITIVNDMMDQSYNQVVDMQNRVKQDRDADTKISNNPSEKKSKMQKAGDDVWNDFDPMTFSMGEGESDIFQGEDATTELAELLQQMNPDQYTDMDGYRRFADLTAKTFFGGNYSRAIQVVQSKMSNLMSKNEGVISGTEGSVIGDNPTTMANTMKDVQGSSDMGGMPDGMFENDFNLKSQGRKDDVVFDGKNAMDDVGVSHGGLTGFNKESDGYYPEYKKPEKEGAPQNKDLGKYDSMTVTEGEEKLDEEGQCRRDEKPVAGKISGEAGACEKKNKKTKADKATDNKFNVKFRNKKEKERENKIEKKHTDYQKELDQNKKHMKKLKEMVEGTETLAEDKRPSSLVQMDRLHKDNKKNFKADTKNSNSAELASDQDELTAKEQIEEVPENAYELAEKIEKKKMEEHEFNSFNNDGNSTNDTNKDIPKRNATDEEADDIMLNRGLAMQDIVYDNKPDERFEERMKKDMGDQIYDQRQEKMKFRADAPMYNKDTQPVEEDAVEKTQFDKNISKFNNPKGVKENHIVAGKFVNDMNKTQVMNFNVNEAVEVKEPIGFKISLEGMGNTYTQGVNENVEMRNMMNSWDFYMNAGKVNKVAKGKQSLTEGEEKKPINEQVQKMMKLAGYKPADHLSTSNVKKNRGF